VATASLLLAQLTFLLSALSGFTVAISFSDWPAESAISVLFSDTLSGCVVPWQAANKARSAAAATHFAAPPAALFAHATQLPLQEICTRPAKAFMAAVKMVFNVDVIESP
jgi:hypothetical protein